MFLYVISGAIGDWKNYMNSGMIESLNEELLANVRDPKLIELIDFDELSWPFCLLDFFAHKRSFNENTFNILWNFFINNTVFLLNSSVVILVSKFVANCNSKWSIEGFIAIWTYPQEIYFSAKES